MRSIPFILFFLSIVFSAVSQDIKMISYRENFFGNRFYLANGQKVKTQEIEEILAVFGDEAREFSTAQNQLILGQSLRWGGLILGLGSVAYLLAGQIDQRRALIAGGMLLGSVVSTSVGFPLIRLSKRRASNAIEIYNYKKSRRFGPAASFQMNVSPLAIGLSLNF